MNKNIVDEIKLLFKSVEFYCLCGMCKMKVCLVMELICIMVSWCV